MTARFAIRVGSARSDVAEDGSSPLAIVCGSGSLPFAVADAVMRRGRKVVLFALHGWADRERVAAYPHHWIKLGRFGLLNRLMIAEGCRDIVLIGGVVRPSIRDFKLDLMTLRLLPRIVRSFRGGDNHLLSRVDSLLSEVGYRAVGAHEVAPEILVPEGALGSHTPSQRDCADIQHALALVAAVGPFDVGQAAVVAEGRVLAFEAAEGTDLMLARVAELRRLGRIRMTERTGVLVKAPKPGQDRRYDLPTIGPATIEGAASAGLAGVAVAANATIIAEPERVVRLADDAKVFVVGVKSGEGD
jgi:DUF1009 family protein